MSQTPQVSLSELNAAIKNFESRYSVGGQPFADKITINWPEFLKIVKAEAGHGLKEVMLRFIHRYDTKWFLTMEVCKMNIQNGAVTPLSTNRYDLVDGTITPSTFTGSWDPTYFANVLFDGQGINHDKYVNNITFPWYQEIWEMHCQNMLPDDESINIVFQSCSFDCTDASDISSVPWPHTIALYMNSTIHGDYLDDAPYTRMFTNKAADMGGMCPPSCNVYAWPAGLPKIPICLP